VRRAFGKYIFITREIIFVEFFDDFRKIIIDEVPLIDVRAPIEFEKGSFRNTVNIPILSNKQRELVGKKYKEEGNEAATKLGYELTKEDKNEKVDQWVRFIDNNPNCLIYCFRGGQRSEIAQKWIYEKTGKIIPRIKGGYKAIRNYLIDMLLPENQNYQAYRLGGLTGVGKTILLHEINEMIDLEGLANHRGSIFGPKIDPQPRQIDFEDNLAYDLIQKQSKGYNFLIFEDEGRHVGKSFLPHKFYEFLSNSPLIVLEASFDQRVDNIMQEYVYDEQKEYNKEFGSEGLDKWQEYINESITKAESRLGNKRYKELIELVDEAVKKQKNFNDKSGHKKWISRFLSNYYDPMYKYQLEKGSDLIVFKGNQEEVKKFIKSIR